MPRATRRSRRRAAGRRRRRSRGPPAPPTARRPAERCPKRPTCSRFCSTCGGSVASTSRVGMRCSAITGHASLTRAVSPCIARPRASGGAVPRAHVLDPLGGGTVDVHTRQVAVVDVAAVQQHEARDVLRAGPPCSAPRSPRPTSAPSRRAARAPAGRRVPGRGRRASRGRSAPRPGAATTPKPGPSTATTRCPAAARRSATGAKYSADASGPSACQKRSGAPLGRCPTRARRAPRRRARRVARRDATRTVPRDRDDRSTVSIRLRARGRTRRRRSRP